ncbi:MAG TPA: ABC transporter ATP-binding protein [Verrucomicrobiae bacterium]|nr:ABC transporter ATP-binding protein [Verrucomicrobiae bacterium]
MNTVIDAHNISKIYNPETIPVYAVNNVHLHLQRGEFTALVGPSGSGKTTLLNLIGGLDKPDEGRIEINGTDITQLSANRLIDFRLHNIGFVFQAFNLVPVLTAEENVEFIMQLQGIPRKQRRQRLDVLFRQIGLEDKRRARPAELSGGQQQRVAVARALASRPHFVLADEPTANLDSKSATNLLDIMAALNKEENMTFIFSTHDQRVIERARRVITLVDGRIESDSAAVDTAADHANERMPAPAEKTNSTP